MNLGTAEVIRADSRHLPIADNSVDLVITSPPYFALRSYQDGGEHYKGQIGDEPTPDEFVSSLLEVTAECVRVLKPSGSLWVNLGDKYAGAPSGPRSGMPDGATRKAEAHIFQTRTRRAQVAPNKSLIGIPWRYALRCIDELGLILRAEVVWSKSNGLPESVTDRVRRSHEQWFHFTLEPRYYSAVDEIREAHSQAWGPIDRVRGRRNVTPDGTPDGGMVERPNPLGKLPGSVWTIPTEPLRVPDHLGVDHFAAFPTEWPKRIIQGWSPAGVCVECGEGRRPVVGYSGPHELAPQRVLSERERWRFRDVFREACAAHGVTSKHLDDLLGTNGMGTQYLTHPNQVAVPTPEKWSLIVAEFGDFPPEAEQIVHKTELLPVRGGNFQASEGARKSGGTGAKQFHHKEPPARSVTGYACACPEPTADTIPAVILDPFGGTGTTAMVAKALGRHGISVDMSADYCRLAEWRVNDRNQLAKVLGVAKAEPVAADEQSLLDLLGGESA